MRSSCRSIPWRPTAPRTHTPPTRQPCPRRGTCNKTHSLRGSPSCIAHKRTKSTTRVAGAHGRAHERTPPLRHLARHVPGLRVSASTPRRAPAQSGREPPDLRPRVRKSPADRVTDRSGSRRRVRSPAACSSMRGRTSPKLALITRICARATGAFNCRQQGGGGHDSRSAFVHAARAAGLRAGQGCFDLTCTVDVICHVALMAACAVV